MVNQWFKKSRSISFAALILALLFALACGTSAPVEPQVVEKEVVVEKAVEKIVVATPTPAPVPVASAIHPGKVTVMVGAVSSERMDYAFNGGFTSNYLRLLHGFLISSNSSLELIPGIASGWSLSDDGLTWTFTIRSGVNYHDGTELTAEDVFWTFQHYIGPGAGENIISTQLISMARITDHIDLIEPDRVSVTTTTPLASLAADYSEATVSSMSVMPKRGKVHDVDQELAYDKNPIGARPMGLVKHVQAYKLGFERFADYYYQPKHGLPEDRRVNFTNWDVLVVPEEATRVAALRAGETDIAPISLASRNQVEAGGAHVVFGREGAYFRIRLHGCWEPELQPPCRDKRVRQALAYAVDKELMRDTLFGPEVMEVKGWAVATPSTIGYSSDLDPFPFDPDKARQLLAEAGYPGGEGFGKLIINTFTSSATPLLPESAQLAAENWKRELGIDVEVRVGEKTAIKKARSAGDLAGQIEWADNETRRDAVRIMFSNYGDLERKHRSHSDPDLAALVVETAAVFGTAEHPKAMNNSFRRTREEQYELAMSLSHEDFRLRYTAQWFHSVNELDQALHYMPLI